MLIRKIRTFLRMIQKINGTKYLRMEHVKFAEDKRKIISQPAFTCSKLTTETLEQGVNYVQS